MFDQIISQLTGFSSIEALIAWGGIILLSAIVFAETGLFFGFFLPGDSLLFTAGMLAAGGFFDIRILLISLIVAAIIGDQVGYVTGKYVGKKLFNRPDGTFFRKEYVEKTHRFYEKYGVSTIVLARFVPIIRTFAPIVAGVGSMKYRTFITYNILGGLGWVLLMCGAGYFLGNIAWVQQNFALVTILIIVISFLPLVFEVWRARRDKVI